MRRECGIHLDGAHPCARCLEAADATAAELADVVARPADRKHANARTSVETEQRIRELRAQGLSYERTS